MTRNPLDNISRYNVLLASHSPRRRELLAMLGINFSIAHSIEVDETYPTSTPPEEVAPYLSRKKAEAYRVVMNRNDLIITADTVVIAAGRILGKPASPAEAAGTLHLLSGNRHKVVTGVTVTTAEKAVTFSTETEVEFAHLDDNEIDFYIQHYSPLDKAGAYGIQEWIGAIGVKSITGSYYNVMGLPLHRLYTTLRAL